MMHALFRHLRPRINAREKRHLDGVLEEVETLANHIQKHSSLYSGQKILVDCGFNSGRLDYTNIHYDDGTRRFDNFDEADTADWSLWQNFFDDAGALVLQRVTYDDGDVVII